MNFLTKKVITEQNYRINKTTKGYIKYYSNHNSSSAKNSNWKSVVGLEIHAQINSQSKLFSGAGTKFAGAPNSLVSFVDAALPGTLPVLNKRCVEAGILTALALNCKVHKYSTFDRKHYFYADLPAGYQITQQRFPLATDGHIDFLTYNVAIGRGPDPCRSKIKQIQLEQDSGKSLHDVEKSRSLIDLNRAGIGLMELVFEPDLTDGEEAGSLVKELCLILERLETCSCQMEEGALRIDANISVHKPNEPLGVRTEVKNLNSIRSIVKAIDFEIIRQIKVLENGGKVSNETRSFNAVTNETVLMRDKEVLQDYRFMPEPNLPPLILMDDSEHSSFPDILNIDTIKKMIPTLPEDDRRMLIKKYGLSIEHALNAVNMEGLQVFFENIVKEPKRNPKFVMNWLVISVQKQLKQLNLSFDKSPVSSERIGQVIDMVRDKAISSGTANKILELMYSEDESSPKDIVSKNNWFQITDETLIEKICLEVITDNPKQVKYFIKGKERGLKVLLKEFNSKTESRCDKNQVTDIFNKLLKNSTIRKL